jgi:hypothetical protein
MLRAVSYSQVVYFLEIGRAEDARHLRLAVTSGLGNVLLLQRGILQMASKIALWRRWECG